MHSNWNAQIQKLTVSDAIIRFIYELNFSKGIAGGVEDKLSKYLRLENWG